MQTVFGPVRTLSVLARRIEDNEDAEGWREIWVQVEYADQKNLGPTGPNAHPEASNSHKVTSARHADSAGGQRVALVNHRKHSSLSRTNRIVERSEGNDAA